MRALRAYAVEACERATTPRNRCRCRCGGECHGKARGDVDTLPKDDPHHVPGRRRMVQLPLFPEVA